MGRTDLIVDFTPLQRRGDPRRGGPPARSGVCAPRPTARSVARRGTWTSSTSSRASTRPTRSWRCTSTNRETARLSGGEGSDEEQHSLPGRAAGARRCRGDQSQPCGAQTSPVRNRPVSRDTQPALRIYVPMLDYDLSLLFEVRLSATGETEVTETHVAMLFTNVGHQAMRASQRALC